MIEQKKKPDKKIYRVITEEGSYQIIAQNEMDAMGICYCTVREKAIDVYEII